MGRYFCLATLLLVAHVSVAEVQEIWAIEQWTEPDSLVDTCVPATTARPIFRFDGQSWFVCCDHDCGFSFNPGDAFQLRLHLVSPTHQATILSLQAAESCRLPFPAFWRVTDSNPALTWGPPSAKYAGWRNHRRPRPLLATLEPLPQLPALEQEWSMSTDQTLRTAFRDAISSDAELDIYEGATFEVASVRTIHLADTQLIACHVPPGRVEWKGLGGDVRLFWMSRYNGQFHYLGKDMHLLETGNFDSDGQTDALFMLTREGADAYLLAYDALTKTLLCETSYH